jgi:ADP-heptose:LPS heptosyltransferase
MELPGHLLIIRLSALGDVAMSVPVIKVLTENYPKLRITLISRPQYKPLFDDIPNLSFLAAEVYGKHKGLGLLRLAKEARSKGVVAVADLHNVIRSKIITRYFKLHNLKVAAIDKGRPEKKALTRKQNKVFKQLRSTHQRYADVFSELGFSIDLEQFNRSPRKEINQKLQNIVGGSTQKWVGIAPFAAFKSKMYPLESMEKVIQKLDDSGKFRILLFGGGSHENKILSALEKKYASTVNIAGRLTFREELDLISNLDIMLSMDSANGHMAALFGIPVITLWGVTHPFAGFKPIHQPEDNQLLANLKEFPLIPTSVYGNKYPKGYENAIGSISPESISNKIIELL